MTSIVNIGRSRAGAAAGAALLAAALGLAGAAQAGAAGGRVVRAELKTADGKDAGHATVREVKGGLRVSIEAVGLTEGQHGAHIHTVGKCDAPDFATAGAHWNPTGRQHGSMNAMGAHGGDLPNLVVGKNGKGALAVTLPGASIDGLLDADGSAIVIHAKPDDLTTDPSGNSGARQACGVLA